MKKRGRGRGGGILGKMGIFSEYGVVRHQILPNMPLTVPIFSFAYAFWWREMCEFFGSVESTHVVRCHCAST